MNKRQQRIVDIMRQVGRFARLRQWDHLSAAWYVTGMWPNKTRVKATCRDVCGLANSGMLVRASENPWDMEIKLGPRALPLEF